MTPELMVRRGCLADWARYSALGAVTFATAVIATLNGGLAAGVFLLGGRVWPAMAAGLGWGLVVLSLDRMLLTSMVKKPDASGARLLLAAGPRIVLAVLAALLISTPAELLLFRHQLDVQVALDQQAEILEQQQALDRRYAVVDDLKARREGYRQEIRQAREAAQGAWREAACEADGGCGSGLRGVGALYAQKEARFRQLELEFGRLETEDKPKIADLEGRIAELEGRKRADLDRFAATTQGGDDILSRLLALRHLEADKVHGGTVRAAKWLVRLLGLALELLPLLTKIYTRGPYDAAFLAEVEGQCAHFDACRRAVVDEADVELQQDLLMGRAVLDASAGLAHAAVADALTGPAAAAARADLAAQVLARSTAMARRTAERVFGDLRMEDDIAQEATSTRRAADERTAGALRAGAETVRGLRAAVCRVRAGLAPGKVANDPEGPAATSVHAQSTEVPE